LKYLQKSWHANPPEQNSQTFKSNDFAVHWTLWPPQDINVYFTGLVDFISISIDVYLFNQWLHLWPW